MSLLEGDALPDVHKQVALDSWPIDTAIERYIELADHFSVLDTSKTVMQLAQEEDGASANTTPGGQPSDIHQQPPEPQSVDLVIVRCDEPLDFISNGSLFWPHELIPYTRLFVYEKCGDRGRQSPAQVPVDGFEVFADGRTVPIRHGVASEGAKNNAIGIVKFRDVFVSAIEDADDLQTGKGARRDECTAYASHVRSAKLGAFEAADYTLFVHGDPLKHWKQFEWSYLNLIFRALAIGRLESDYFVRKSEHAKEEKQKKDGTAAKEVAAQPWLSDRSVRFLHLSTPRLVAVKNPCQDHVYEYVMGRRLEHDSTTSPALLNTYCCAQFLVSKSAIDAIPLDRVERLNRIVDGSIPDLCNRVGPSFEKYAGERLVLDLLFFEKSRCFFVVPTTQVIVSTTHDTVMMVVST